MKTYHGLFGLDPLDETQVLVREDGQPDRFLPLRLDLVNYSPTGFSWGYLGAGPAQLAMALLADCVGDGLAKEFYGKFHHSVIARTTQRTNFEFTEQAIREWVDRSMVERTALALALEGSA